MSNIRAITPKDFLVITFCCLYAILTVDMSLSNGLKGFTLVAGSLVKTVEVLTHPVGVIVLAVGMTVFHLISYSAVTDKVDLEVASFYASGPLFLLIFLTSYLSLSYTPNLTNYLGVDSLVGTLDGVSNIGIIARQIITLFLSFIVSTIAYLILVVTIGELYKSRKKNIK